MSRGNAVLLDHGSGGRASRRLVEDVLLPHLHNDALDRMDDSAELRIGASRTRSSGWRGTKQTSSSPAA